MPKAKGGDDGMYNLVTACKDCNRGKRDRQAIFEPDMKDWRATEPMMISFAEGINFITPWGIMARRWKEKR